MKRKMDYFSNLFKQDDKKAVIPSPSTKEIESNKRIIRDVCNTLKIPAENYDPVQSIRLLNEYLNSEHRINRLLYSELSNFMFSLELRERATLNTNKDKLLQYALDGQNQVGEDCQKIVMKIYDHSQLVIYQIENSQNIVAAGIEEEKVHLESEIKGIEKEYITILGIFASIVLAFVGNFIFSSSVLQNIAQANIYRLLLTIDLLGFFFVTIILALVRFILYINDRYITVIKLKNIVKVCAAIAGVILLGWLFQVDRIPEWIVTWLPWGK